jgi:hypothetical protein
MKMPMSDRQRMYGRITQYFELRAAQRDQLDGSPNLYKMFLLAKAENFGRIRKLLIEDGIIKN